MEFSLNNRPGRKPSSTVRSGQISRGRAVKIQAPDEIERETRQTGARSGGLTTKKNPAKGPIDDKNRFTIDEVAEYDVNTGIYRERLAGEATSSKVVRTKPAGKNFRSFRGTHD